jgi:GAF domain-containing protein
MTRASRARRSARRTPSRKASKRKPSKAAVTELDAASRLRKQLKQRTSELARSRAQQIATADVLKAISRSAFDLQTVLQSLIESAARLADANTGTITRQVDGVFYRAETFGRSAEEMKFLRTIPMVPERGSAAGRALLEGAVVHVPDVEADPEFTFHQNFSGFRTALAVPMLREGTPIGVIVLTRAEPRAFTDRQIELVRTFADQALIAIQNAQLFDQVQARTRELTEALIYQTGSTNILRVIASSPTHVTPVLQAIAESACEVCEAIDASVVLQDGDHLTFSGHHGPLHIPAERMPISRGWVAGRAFIDQKPVHVEDFQAADHSEFPEGRVIAERSGHRTTLGVPLLRENESIGAIVVRRIEVRPFTPKQIELIRTFADQAVIAIENARLFNETKEALERQSATADILKIIASSPTDLQPVFDAIAERSNMLIGGHSTAVYRFVDETAILAAFTRLNPEADAALRDMFPRPLSCFQQFESVSQGEILQIDDLNADGVREETRQLARARGWQSCLFVPLATEHGPVGVIVVTRKKTGTFSDHHVQLLKTFADQAVIAIQNVKLFEEVQAKTRDLEESLQQQTATSEVLEVISSSTGDVDPVFRKLLENATRVCGAEFGSMNLFEDGLMRRVAHYNMPAAFAAVQTIAPFRPHPESGLGTAIRARETVHLPDLRITAAYLERDPAVMQMADLAGARTIVTVPMLRDEDLIGTITIYRQEVLPFSEKQIELVKNFASQAVIAIENTRLLKELRASTNDLSESLQQQTATSEVLQVISSSTGDVEPVFQKLLENATRVCGAEFGSMNLLEDGVLRQAALYNAPAAFAAVRANRAVLHPHPDSTIATAIRTRQVIYVDDLRTTRAYLERGQSTVDLVELGGARTSVIVPMLRDDELIGVITIYRGEVRPFTEKQVELVKNFASQAIIAIENTRLLKELRTRTDDLSESLQQQTATSEVLRVISSSVGELEPVFIAMLESAARICDAAHATMYLREGDIATVAAQCGPLQSTQIGEQMLLDRGLVSGRAMLEARTIHVSDLATSDEFPLGRDRALRLGNRATLGVPLLRDGAAIGAILLRRDKPVDFTPKQIELVTNFANQAVIAIENARLFEEVRARTRDLSESLQFQTATSDVLKIIGRSPDTLQPVLDVIVNTSRQLCDSETSTFLLLRDGVFRLAAAVGDMATFLNYIETNPIRVDQKGSVAARALREKRTVHIPNTAEDPESGFGNFAVGEPRALLSVPLIHNDQAIGFITLRKSPLTPFTPRQIEAVETFADQALIAISNVNLFEEVQRRTRELSKSLEDLRTAQDRLVQTEKLASLGQLTAGIAHEIKNPLNFVNNFSALSAELVDEMTDVLENPELDEKNKRKELDEIRELLKSNLEKVVQHGKRADSIVKNMLLHSRQGSGEHRMVDINALVDESLNLAYHGARAEKTGFNITLERDFDPTAGIAEVFPQEITRVFLNMISNGFYAATKRAAEAGNGFQPIVRAATRNLGDRVEIRIRDNGLGMTSEVKEKIFNPFFTTKPPGEGTGLGLSMSHDIVVKQHGGTIDVDTVPGVFTEFRIVLPRAGGSLIKSGG